MKALARKQGNGRESMLEPIESEFARFRDEIDRAINRMWGGALSAPFTLFPEAMLAPQLKTWSSWPAIDVSEDDKGVTIRADVPGMDAKDVAVEVSGNAVTIRGAREEEKEEKNASMWRRERRLGKFERTITLPQYIDVDKLDAKYEKGTLTVTAPRSPGEAPKRVEVKNV